jgi:hypothetical protein
MQAALPVAAVRSLHSRRRGRQGHMPSTACAHTADPWHAADQGGKNVLRLHGAPTKAWRPDPAHHPRVPHPCRLTRWQVAPGGPHTGTVSGHSARATLPPAPRSARVLRAATAPAAGPPGPPARQDTLRRRPSGRPSTPLRKHGAGSGGQPARAARPAAGRRAGRAAAAPRRRGRPRRALSGRPTSTWPRRPWGP